jgi:hypothetical protein
VARSTAEAADAELVAANTALGQKEAAHEEARVAAGATVIASHVHVGDCPVWGRERDLRRRLGEPRVLELALRRAGADADVSA